jgi:hypothetical protein
MSPQAVENWDAFGCANGTLARAVVAVGSSFGVARCSYVPGS